MSSKRRGALRNSAAPPALARVSSRRQEDSGEEEGGGGGSEMEVEVDDDGTSRLRRNEENLKKSMAIDVGLRKGQRQKRLEKEFESQFRELEAQIDERVEKYQQDGRRIQDDFVARLLALIERKAEVEKGIIQAVQDLATAHEMIKEELQAILEGRSADVREAMNGLQEAQEKASARPN